MMQTMLDNPDTPDCDQIEEGLAVDVWPSEVDDWDLDEADDEPGP